MKPWASRIIAVVLTGWALTACSAANPVINEWRNPAYSSANFKRILASGPGFATSVRRNLEDEFVIQLRAAGIDALPSYSTLPDSSRTRRVSSRRRKNSALTQRSLCARFRWKEKPSMDRAIFLSPGLGISVRISARAGTADTAHRASIITTNTLRKRPCMTSRKTRLFGPVRFEPPILIMFKPVLRPM